MSLEMIESFRQIEALRKQMLETAATRSMTDREVVEISQRLDEALNHHYRLLAHQKKRAS
ncbi:hypothetical protein J31TS4_23610 [Paenibacillus sp. J31TS4]|uniref:aspartyl-phosphate phosphatase Spo0E family protein n=1 Tax=Paenibacillus sp. J31TS4 TaxID=2807195 RepID=UPI001B05EB04|nr:aspartyl-phosphate phosphatase Spo0E family protein [Paenibacillus sp. J31TS4]GIP39081.1 hypothetical protein J31TS4_23610 [Paenibacillus sp. J31TS4]